MKKLVEKISEKTIDFWIRNILRLMCWIVLMFYMIFKILVPVKNNHEVTLTDMDVKIIISCMALLLAIESVRAIFRTRLKSLEEKIDDKLEKEE